jgi:hypothetical protein
LNFPTAPEKSRGLPAAGRALTSSERGFVLRRTVSVVRKKKESKGSDEPRIAIENVAGATVAVPGLVGKRILFFISKT